MAFMLCVIEHLHLLSYTQAASSVMSCSFITKQYADLWHLP